MDVINLYKFMQSRLLAQKGSDVKDIRLYPVVIVLNAGQGPDEELLKIYNITIDWSLGILRLEAQ